MKHIILLLLPLLLIACSDDKDGAIPNVYDGFKVSPELPVHGQKVTITAHVLIPGQHLIGNSTSNPKSDHGYYLWTLHAIVDDAGTRRDSVQTVKQYCPSDGTQYRDATVTFTLPHNAMPGTSANVHFEAVFQNSADGAEYATYGGTTGEGLTGRITSVVSTLYTKSSGQCSFMIR